MRGKGKGGSLELLQLQNFFLDHVLNSAWCSHNYIHPSPQCVLLGTIRAASIDACALKVEGLADQLKVCKYLQKPEALLADHLRISQTSPFVHDSAVS